MPENKPSPEAMRAAAKMYPDMTARRWAAKIIDAEFAEDRAATVRLIEDRNRAYETLQRIFERIRYLSVPAGSDYGNADIARLALEGMVLLARVEGKSE